MRFKIRLLFAGFIVSFLLVGAFTVLTFFQTRRLNEHVAQVEHTYQVANAITAVSAELTDVDKAVFRFTTTGDSVFYHFFIASTDQLYQTTRHLKDLTISQKDKAVLLLSAENIFINDSRMMMEKAPRGTLDFLRSAEYAENMSKLGACMKLLKELRATTDQLLQIRRAERDSYLHVSSATMRALLIAFGLLAAVLFFFLMREFRRRVNYQNELQLRIAETTQSKKELEQIAYATSHDLQEPLRKIRILTDRWHSQYRQFLTKESSDMLDRVVSAASKMQELVGELMMLASLNADAKKVRCDVRTTVDTILEQFRETISGKHATIHIGQLPVILGYPDQLKMLFKNLIDNALKFSRQGMPPEISITARMADNDELAPGQRSYQQYHCVIIEDNGIGFDNRQAEKMFGIFRQLHNTHDGYVGKGTGLAICQRIMSNHRGHIIAHGFPGEGAVFKLYFPIYSPSQLTTASPPLI